MAAGGAEGIALAEANRPDLVLLDLVMPDPNGYAVLGALRSREETRSLPVIVLTAEDDEYSARQCFELGATDFLSKPFTPPQLNARVRACLARTRDNN
jgi:DNA-binding response OmpR family regulator